LADNVNGTGFVTTGSGLFCFKPDTGSNDVDASVTLNPYRNATPFYYDAFPLFIGMPEGIRRLHAESRLGVRHCHSIGRTGLGGHYRDLRNRGYPPVRRFGPGGQRRRSDVSL